MSWQDRIGVHQHRHRRRIQRRKPARSGLLGIAPAPLIHGSWEHVIGNTLPLILLGSMLIYGHPRSRLWALAGIWLLSGAGVWLFARGSYHFGASGLTHGIFFYLFIGGILRRDGRSAALLMVAFYMYDGMLISLLPSDPGVSFESHFFGALSGATLAYVFRNWGPKPVRKRYVWEPHTDEDEDLEEDPIIGNQWQVSPPDTGAEKKTLTDEYPHPAATSSASRTGNRSSKINLQITWGKARM